ncbi:hypothetical protein B0A52_03898 [Exophiala mesophila]|uniref:Uncharacterized protein n=1 Tax=Exophiala mesophila TaxID=212818 RepID=A0A438N7I5_EXOME|nr:hypothetical protein B0A52_03898 [Exophiala mesophila]
MKVLQIMVCAASMSQAAAQSRSSDPIDQLISDALSVYTQVTSMLASAVSVATATPASSLATTTSSSPASTTASSSSSEPESSSSASTADSTGQSSSSTISASGSMDLTSSSPSPVTLSSSSGALSTSIEQTSLPTSSIQGAAAETATPAASSGTSNKGHHKLAIILGSVLGILALGFFLLAIVLCQKRRRHPNTSPRHSALSPADEDIESWRVREARRFDSSHHDQGDYGAPLMTESARRNSQENPFVPVPPPPRRSAPNSRAGLTDGMVPGDEPFLDDGSGYRLSKSRSRDSASHKKGALAAGIAGAAVSAGLMHHHKAQDDEKTLVADDGALPTEAEPIPPSRPRSITRKPVPVNNVNNSEPWPYSPVSPISPIEPETEMESLNKLSSRSSGESRRSFHRDAARANAAFDQEYSPHLDDEPEGGGHHGNAMAIGAGGLAIGALGGAAIAHDQNNKRRSRSSSGDSNSGLRRHSQGSNRRYSRSPHRLSGEVPSPGYDLSTSSSDTYVEDKTEPSPPQNVPPPSRPGNPRRDSDPDPSTIPPTPTTRSRRNSALGTMAPPSAIHSYIHRPAIPSPLSTELLPDSYTESDAHHRLPSRSPRRSSLGVIGSGGAAAAGGRRSRISQDYTPYDIYSANPWTSNNMTSPYPVIDDPAPVSSSKAIVGDNGYPHMGVPRRRSGGEYDYLSTGIFGPQTVTEPEIVFAPAPGRDGFGGSGTRTMSMASDDSTWRVSSGMPGGWSKTGGGSDVSDGGGSRGSRELRRPTRLRARDMRGGDDGRHDLERGAYDGSGVGQAM